MRSPSRDPRALGPRLGPGAHFFCYALRVNAQGGGRRWQYPVQPYVDPRYVGPRWAAPGPPRPLPPRRTAPKRSGGGCLLAAAVLFGLFVVFLGGAAVLVAIGTRDEDRAADLPQEQKGNLPAVAPIGGKPDATAQSVWTAGVCGDFSKERDRTAYFATRNEGSARVLRGRVAMIHIRVNSPTLRWTKGGEVNVNRAALMSQEFVLTHAKRYSVAGLTFDVIPWSLKTTYQLPDLGTNTNHKLDDQTMRFVRDGAREAVEAALSARMESVVASVKAGGYDEVGFVIHFPTKTDARDFAFSAFHGEPKDKSAEMAFIFSPTSDFGHFAVTVTHEGLHLFGADDLYRIEHLDARDQHDIMGEYCTGFRQAIVHDATAYAIGWSPSPPPRGYAFEDR